jgi:hypothetical protein
LDDVAEKLGIDWSALLKDARSMIGMLADKVMYSKELDIGCWQLVNLEIVEDKKMREEIEWARQLRTYHSSKLSILRNLTDIVQHLVTE